MADGRGVRGRSWSLLAVRSPMEATTAQAESEGGLPSHEGKKGEPPNIPQIKVVDLGAGAFDFVKSLSLAGGPTLGRRSAPPSDDATNVMKYKRAGRRGSIQSSDGAFQMNFLAAPKGDSKLRASVSTSEIAAKSGTAGSGVPAADQSVKDQTAAESSPPGLQLRRPTPPLQQQQQQPKPLRRKDSDEEREPSSVTGKILNHWFFRNRDVAASAGEEAVVEPTPPPSVSEVDGEGGGGGSALRSKVIAALGLHPPSMDPKDSRKMNVWMPQGM